jgi:hypothetical protein
MPMCISFNARKLATALYGRVVNAHSRGDIR